MRALIHFANSSFYFATITFFVGFIAIALYLRQRQDFKRDAASLILQEIRYAENRLRSFNVSFGFHFHDRVMPTSSWHKNINLFVNDLEEYEIDLISGFYTRCEYVDILIRKIADQEFFPSTIHSASQPLAQFPTAASSPTPQPTLNPTPSNFSQITPSQPQAPLVSQTIVNPKAQAHLHDLTLELRTGNLLTSAVGEHLRKISTTRRYRLF